jgi:hypothetical protein
MKALQQQPVVGKTATRAVLYPYVVAPPRMAAKSAYVIFLDLRERAGEFPVGKRLRMMAAKRVWHRKVITCAYVFSSRFIKVDIWNDNTFSVKPERINVRFAVKELVNDDYKFDSIPPSTIARSTESQARV